MERQERVYAVIKKPLKKGGTILIVCVKNTKAEASGWIKSQAKPEDYKLMDEDLFRAEEF